MLLRQRLGLRLVGCAKLVTTGIRRATGWGDRSRWDDFGFSLRRKRCWMIVPRALFCAVVEHHAAAATADCTAATSHRQPPATRCAQPQYHSHMARLLQQQYRQPQQPVCAAAAISGSLAQPVAQRPPGCQPCARSCAAAAVMPPCASAPLLMRNGRPAVVTSTDDAAAFIWILLTFAARQSGTGGERPAAWFDLARLVEARLVFSSVLKPMSMSENLLFGAGYPRF